MERIWKGHQTVSLCALWVFVERAYQRVTGLCVMATVYWRPGKLCRLHNHLYCVLVQVGTLVTFPFGVVLFLARCKHFSFSNWMLCRMNHIGRSYVILVFIIVYNSCYFRHWASCNHWSACSFIKLMPFNYLTEKRLWKIIPRLILLYYIHINEMIVSAYTLNYHYIFILITIEDKSN